MMTKPNKPEIRFTIAEITFAMIGESLPEDFKGFTLPGSRKAFEGGTNQQANYRIHYGTLPEYSLDNQVFDSSGLWRLYEENNRHIITLRSPALGKDPFKMAVFNQDYSDGDIFLNQDLVPDNKIAYPLGYPLDELMMISFFCHGRGLVIHGCGIIDDGACLAFLGVSGAGKSTMANLWKNNTKSVILSDDRLVVRKKEGRFWLFGTPWHGEAKVASPAGAPLGKLFFIKQAPKNYMKRLSPAEMHKRLMLTCFPTFWDKRGLDFVLEFNSELCHQVAGFELGVVPNKIIIDKVRKETG